MIRAIALNPSAGSTAPSCFGSRSRSRGSAGRWLQQRPAHDGASSV